MERDTTKIRELIEKQLLEIITEKEEVELAERKVHYSEDEYDCMLIEVLGQLESRLPKDSLGDWTPDYEEIKRRGEDIRRQRKRKQYSMLGYAAALVLFMGAAVLYLFSSRQKKDVMLHLDSKCLNVGDNEEIPLAESSCLVLSADSSWIRVEQDTFGEIMQLGNVVINRTTEGLLRVQRKYGANDVADGRTSLDIYTGPRQQCVVELEDGTQIRLNAQSRLSYPIVKRDSTIVYIHGEAYVNAKSRSKNAPLIIGTEKGELIARHADFLVRSDTSMMKTILNDGTLQVYAYHLKKGRSIICPGDFVFVGAKNVGKNQHVQDTMDYVANLDFEDARMWTRKIRIYKDIPLYVFVDEMSRWEGFVIKKWDCIPKNKHISVSICYQSGREDVYAAIRQAGILLHEKEGMISFCPEDKHERVAMRQLNGGNRKIK
ncbi:FecR family protein [Sphingobacterium thalpophilum]|uniref:FecR family protein n=1 Tax=Sphingobacterium thalpophilum TaxID=259 RepID=A0ACD5C6H1_9SPHI|nr:MULTISPECIES: FecR family protein [Sphingobacterium]